MQENECDMPCSITMDYATLNGFRLPTEAEWEYACRAGTTTSRYFGNDEQLLRKYAWFAGNADEITHPVGTRMPDDFGLFDMLGNVFMWCGDSFLPYEAAASDIWSTSCADCPPRRASSSSTYCPTAGSLPQPNPSLRRTRAANA